jgi:hypothetical protein
MIQLSITAYHLPFACTCPWWRIYIARATNCRAIIHTGPFAISFANTLASSNRDPRRPKCACLLPPATTALACPPWLGVRVQVRVVGDMVVEAGAFR